MSGTKHLVDKEAFVDEIDRMINEAVMQGVALVPGYAPFCWHLFLRNFAGAKLGALRITQDNTHRLQCGYSRRRSEELPALTRWFPGKAVKAPIARYLDIILYTRDQLVNEQKPCLAKESDTVPDGYYGIT